MNDKSDWTANPQRLNSLTDGIYAIVITLLVLDLKPPTSADLSNVALQEHILGQFPSFLTYIASFAVIAQIWQRHHRLFSHQLRCDLPMVALNFVHIFLVTMIPYTSSLVGHFETDRFAVILFSIDLAASGGALTLIAVRMRNKPELRESEKPVALLNDHWLVRSFYGIMGVLSISASYFNLHLALTVWIVGALLMLYFSRQ